MVFVPDPSKVEKVKNYPVPKSVAAVRSFLGLVSYYRKFILDFASIAAPLTDLTKKDQRFLWAESCQSAFDKLKNMLITEPILQFPRFDRKFMIQCDASQFGIGGILSQYGNDSLEHPVSYWSRILSRSERNYSTIDRECLAIIECVRAFKTYVWNTPFVLITDHAPLRYLNELRHKNSRLARWSLELIEYNYTVQYKPGSRNTNADSLSRMYVDSIPDTKDINISEFDFISLCTDAFREEQLKDPALALIIHYLENQALPLNKKLAKSVIDDSKSYVMEDKRLFKCITESNIKLAVPEHLIPDILELCHNSKFSGHFGVRRTLEKVSKKFHWDTLPHDVDTHCKTCLKCQQRNRPHKTLKAPLVTIKSSYPFEHVVIDLCSMPLSLKGNKVVMVITDHFTKYVALYALPDMLAATVAKTFVDKYICIFGPPKIISSDRGTQFTSELFVEVCKMMNVETRTSTAYRPQSQGITERFNQTMESVLSKLVSPSLDDWDEMLGFVAYAYNTSKHETTKTEPCNLVFGRDLPLPSAFGLDLPRTTYVDIDDYKASLTFHLQKAQEIALKLSHRSQETTKKQHDKSVFQPYEFHDRDLVLLYFPQHHKKVVTRKLSRNWVGPYQIIEIQLPNIKIKNCNKRNEPADWVHVTRLKPYHLHYPQTLDSEPVSSNPRNSQPSFRGRSVRKPKQNISSAPIDSRQHVYNLRPRK